MPLFHVHGLMAGTLAVLAAGGAVVLPAAGRFSAATFWPDAVENKVTFFTAVPTIHQILVSRAAADFPAAAPPPLRVIRSCSASLAPATLAAVEAAFGAPVLEAYAMTEAAHQMTSNPLPKHGPRRPGTVGKAQGSVSVAILDKDCAQLGVGAVGEVCVRGPNVTAGYRANPAANAEAYAGGWFHTGDQVRGVGGGGCTIYFMYSGVYTIISNTLSF
jgi:acyl-CoA synthetase (AMP-forming)/AMP-acid ligase II